MKNVPLTQGMVALIDDDDWPIVRKYRWCAHRIRNTFYAATNVRLAPGKWKTLHLHHLLLQPPAGMVVDHINRHGLDNRRSNLRIVTNQENVRNCRLRKQRLGTRRGVSWYGRYQKWKAWITLSGKTVFLGYYLDEEDAEIVVDVARQIFYPQDPKLGNT